MATRQPNGRQSSWRSVAGLEGLTTMARCASVTPASSVAGTSGLGCVRRGSTRAGRMQRCVCATSWLIRHPTQSECASVRLRGSSHTRHSSQAAETLRGAPRPRHAEHDVRPCSWRRTESLISALVLRYRCCYVSNRSAARPGVMVNIITGARRPTIGKSPNREILGEYVIGHDTTAAARPAATPERSPLRTVPRELSLGLALATEALPYLATSATWPSTTAYLWNVGNTSSNSSLSCLALRP